VRVRLIYWPRIYKCLRPLHPLEAWVYKKLRAPRPLSAEKTLTAPEPMAAKAKTPTS
jgi:hypothetical protein